jgi:hypothetical protein
LTRKLTISSSALEQRFRRAGLMRVADLLAIWGKKNPISTLHDPAAGLGLFAPELFQWKSAELTSRAGFTWAHYQAAGKNAVARSTDQEKFFERYFRVIDSVV